MFTHLVYLWTCHGETLSKRDPTLYNGPLSFPRDPVYIMLCSEQPFTRGLFCEEGQNDYYKFLSNCMHALDVKLLLYETVKQI